MRTFARFMLAGVGVASLALVVPHASTAAGGVAYDSVSKFAMGNQGTAQPGTFSADFDAASQPVSDPHLPFGLGHGMGAAMAMMKTGTAEKYYYGTHKRRVDNLASQTADITDCTAGTLTRLDLAKKTYTVSSLDQPAASGGSASGPHGAPGPAPTDDGSTYAFDVTNKALGPLEIDGTPTQGYDMTIKMTVTKPSGESSTSNMEMTAYFAAMAEPPFSCGSLWMGASAPAGSRGATSMAGLSAFMRLLINPKGNPRFTATISGPPLPSDKFTMWALTRMGTGDRSGSFGFLTERGHVHAPLSDSDPIFSVPSDFTKSG